MATKIDPINNLGGTIKSAILKNPIWGKNGDMAIPNRQLAKNRDPTQPDQTNGQL